MLLMRTTPRPEKKAAGCPTSPRIGDNGRQAVVTSSFRSGTPCAKHAATNLRFSKFPQGFFLTCLPKGALLGSFRCEKVGGGTINFVGETMRSKFCHTAERRRGGSGVHQSQPMSARLPEVCGQHRELCHHGNYNADTTDAPLLCRRSGVRIIIWQLLGFQVQV